MSLSHNPARCYQAKCDIRPVILILSVLRYSNMHSETDGKANQDATEQAVKMYDDTTAGHLLNFCFPCSIICNGCLDDLQQSLRTTVIALASLMRKRPTSYFITVLERCL